MRKTNLLRTIAAVSALIFYSQGVLAKELAEMPKEFRGTWYETDSKGRAIDGEGYSIGAHNGPCSPTTACNYITIERKSDGSVDFTDFQSIEPFTKEQLKKFKSLKPGKHVWVESWKDSDGRVTSYRTDVMVPLSVNHLKLDSKGFLTMTDPFSNETIAKLTKKPPKQPKF